MPFLQNYGIAVFSATHFYQAAQSRKKEEGLPLLFEWCAARDLNPQALRRWDLNPVRLPFRQLRRKIFDPTQKYPESANRSGY